ncbi:MAG: tRNA (adenosine(37)-N6)-dimethylallyltransferase MiaA [Gemmatimonadetes bacterium]|nr:MAG: tRNA (adenosine(37)-N6)-dimethylallyltransferase MiaA [Gemmatimonadota bacterium]
MPDTYDLVIIAGPTAVGKTALGIRVAHHLNGEIISADSRQIYRYLDIGTAKPTPQEQAAVFHHQIDIVSPDQSYDAAQFATDSHRIIDQLRKRSKTPVIVGGSGLYIRALIEGFFSGPPADPEIRNKLKNLPLASLYDQLRQVDPPSAARIHPHDRKRLVRALEVYHGTGKTLTAWHTEHQAQSNPRYDPLFIGLTRDRAALYQRIELRVDQMIEMGLFDEVQSILDHGFSPDLNALNTIGYKESIAYLQGRISQTDAVNQIKQNSRRYAKRQLTWFRANPRIQWLDVGEQSSADICAEILHLWEHPR